MSIPLTNFSELLPHIARLAIILFLALLADRLLRSAVNRSVKPDATQAKSAPKTVEQEHGFAESICRAGSAVVWVIAVMTALPEFGISAMPAAVMGGATILAVSIGARNELRDVIAGLRVAKEQPFATGDTIQVGEITGRVERMALRYSVLRDARGALVSVSNGEMRTISNLSKDWSQAYVDIGVAASTPLESTLRALEKAAAELRGDSAWSAAIVDGPRLLGLQGYDQNGATLRLQVRTAPTRQDEVCRELRRRIQIEFQRQGIASRTGDTAALMGSPLT